MKFYSSLGDLIDIFTPIEYKICEIHLWITFGLEESIKFKYVREVGLVYVKQPIKVEFTEYFVSQIQNNEND